MARYYFFLVAVLFVHTSRECAAQVYISNGTFDAVEIIKHPGSELLPNTTINGVGPKKIKNSVSQLIDNEVHVAFNQAGTHLVVGLANGSILIFEVIEEVEGLVLGEKTNIRVKESDSIPFYLQSTTLVDIHPFAPKTGFVMALGEDRYSNAKYGSSSKVRSMIQMLDGKQAFHKNGVAAAFQDPITGIRAGLSFSPSGEKEVFFDETKFEVTSKSKSANTTDQFHQVIFSQNQQNIKSVSWLNENLLVFADDTITAYDPLTQKKIFYKKLLNASAVTSEGSKILSCHASEDDKEYRFELLDIESQICTSFYSNKSSKLSTLHIPRVTDNSIQNSIFAAGFDNGDIILFDTKSGTRILENQVEGSTICSIDSAYRNQTYFMAVGTNAGGIVLLKFQHK